MAEHCFTESPSLCRDEYTRIKIEEVEEPQEQINTCLCEDPNIYTIDNYVTKEECEHMMKLGKENLIDSVVSNDKGGYKSTGRTSKTNWIDHFHDSITTNLALKISNQVGIPIENAEKFQIVYYGENNEYRAHYDSWDNDGSEKSLRCVKFGGPRLKTALVYLNTVEEGGSTRFTKLNKEVSAQQGKLLVFDNVYKDTINKHHLSEHAGMPVKKGEKFIFNLWFRHMKKSVPYINLNPEYYKIHEQKTMEHSTLIKSLTLNSQKNDKLIKIHDVKNIYVNNKYLSKDICDMLIGKCQFSNSRFPSAWLKNEQHVELIENIASFLKIDSKYFENMNVIKYDPKQNHGPFYDGYDVESVDGKKYTAKLGQRLQTITIVLKNNIQYLFNNLNATTTLQCGDMIFYDNVMETTQRDSNMIHTIRNLTNEPSYIVNIYVRELNNQSVSNVKSVFQTDHVRENVTYEVKEKEDHYKTFDEVLTKFRNNEVKRVWSGHNSFKYSFRGDFDYFNKCVQQFDVLKQKNEGLNKALLETDYVFDEYNPVILSNVVHPNMIELLQGYYRKTIKENVWALGDRQANRYKSNNEPFSRFLHYEALPLIEKITKKKLMPTYTYLSSYVKDSDLPAHTDRPDCEFTVSFLVNKDKDWPIYCHKTKQPIKNKGRYDFTPPHEECLSLDCDSNGLIIFCGTDHIHYRDKFDGEFYDVLLLHYRQDFS